MIQRGCGERFLLEAPQAVGIARECLGQHFDCDLATQAGIAGAVHLAHAARA